MTTPCAPRRVVPGLALAAAVAGLAACGSTADAGTATGAGAGRCPTLGGVDGAAMRVTGGYAGVSERMTLTHGGRATAATRRTKRTTVTVPAAQRQRIFAALDAAKLGDLRASPYQATATDDFAIVLRYRGHTVCGSESGFPAPAQRAISALHRIVYRNGYRG
jgi:hypothetical protein